jgi:hypothetical protein
MKNIARPISAMTATAIPAPIPPAAPGDRLEEDGEAVPVEDEEGDELAETAVAVESVVLLVAELVLVLLVFVVVDEVPALSCGQYCFSKFGAGASK